MKGRLSCLMLLIVSLAVHAQNDSALIHIRLIDGQTGLLRTEWHFPWQAVSVSFAASRKFQKAAPSAYLSEAASREVDSCSVTERTTISFAKIFRSNSSISTIAASF